MTSQPHLRSVQCLDRARLRKVAYWEWGDPDQDHVILCLHGLTRQGRDFDTLARHLSNSYRVVCPDFAGRGQSDWLVHSQDYAVPTYLSDLMVILAQLNATKLYVVGTSLGGLVAMTLAGLSNNPIERLVLNDIGPVIDLEAVKRIGSYVGQPLTFSSVDDGIAYLGQISQSFGKHTPEQWRELSMPLLVPNGEGKYQLHYDPKIAENFKYINEAVAQQSNESLWKVYDAITCPTLLIRGKDSDLLSTGTAIEMTQRGPKATLIEFKDVGHAPTLMQEDQLQVVMNFLSS